MNEEILQFIKKRQEWFGDYKDKFPQKEWREINAYLEIWLFDAYKLGDKNI